MRVTQCTDGNSRNQFVAVGGRVSDLGRWSWATRWGPVPLDAPPSHIRLDAVGMDWDGLKSIGMD